MKKAGWSEEMGAWGGDGLAAHAPRLSPISCFLFPVSCLLFFSLSLSRAGGLR